MAIIISFNSVYSQSHHPDFWDGQGYFKITDNFSKQLPEWDNSMDLERLSEFPELVSLIEFGQITHLHKAFKTKSLDLIYKFHFEKVGQTDRLIEALERLPYIEYAHQNPIFYLFYNPNDVHANQWYLNDIQAFDAWGLTFGDPNVTVAIIDDAVKISHPDLAPIIYTNPNETLDGFDTDGNGFVDDIHGWDVADNNNDPEPPDSHWAYDLSPLIFTHGTHCAGIAAAATDNDIGIASIGFGISIIPVKAMRDNSFIPLALDAGPEGVDYAIAAGADIISLSWGSGQNVPAVQAVVNAALNAGIMVVAAAGNDGNTSLMYPASYSGVVSVGATTHNDIIANFSQRNEEVSVMAPGDEIWSTVRADDGYEYLEGTSMAAPMVAGLLGLMKSFDTTFTSTMLIDCLLAGCDDLDSINIAAAGLMGAGRINAYKSLLCMQSIQNIDKYTDVNFAFFPNPASSQLFVQFESKLDLPAEVNITDMTGRTVIQRHIDGNHSILEMDVSKLSAGMYIIKLAHDGKYIINEKLIIY